MTRYDMMKRGGFNSLEEMDEAYRRERERAEKRIAEMKSTEKSSIKIIKPGKTKEELDRIDKAIKRFKCDRCDCVFETDKTVYTSRRGSANEIDYVCTCPNCSDLAHEIFDWNDEDYVGYRK